MPPPPPETYKILASGMLPENLPPVFTSTKVAALYSKYGKSYIVDRHTTGSLARHSASKRGRQRREFTLAHPTFTHDQALFFEKHWSQVEPLLSASPGSLSKPTFGHAQGRPVRITSHSDLPAARLKTFSRSRYCLITDVSRCYPSIYTHSIPWAINGKAASKADHSPTSTAVYGNRLDYALRQCQDGQTIGIPIGSDTSKMISEVVLSAVDKRLLEKYRTKTVSYIRHVDDYWIGGESVEECEAHLANLRSALREFELDINELKTRTISTNLILGESWPLEMERGLKRVLPGLFTHQEELLSVLSNILQRAEISGDDGTVRHAIRQIDENKRWKANWNILEHFLAQCSIQFPHSFDYVARVIAWRVRSGEGVDRELWRDVSRTVAFQSARLGRDSEVIWSLWLMKELKVRLTKQISAAIIDACGPLALAMLAHMHANKLTSDAEIGRNLWARVDLNKYTGPYWPLTLELTHLQIADTTGNAGVGGSEPMKMLHDAQASLIDWNAAPFVFTVTPGPNKKKGPTRAIEALSSDYETDTVEDYFDDEAD